MSNMKDAKRTYDQIPIPEELSARVNAAIAESGRREKRNEGRKNRYLLRRTGVAAAAVLAVFTVALNTNTAFARELSELPVIGAVARVLTFRSYEEDTGDLKISVEIPSVEMIAEGTDGLTDSLNEEIHQFCEQYAQEAVERAEEYREAFLATGGTEEEWEAHNIQIKVWYEIKAQTEDYLSFAVMGSENWNSGYRGGRYYSIDLKTGNLVSLEDVLGEDYIRIANESITRQLEQKEAETGMEFWTAEEGGFAGITEDTRFYMNEAGNPVIVFGKYEIAPGAAGEPKFEIKER